METRKKEGSEPKHKKREKGRERESKKKTGYKDEMLRPEGGRGGGGGAIEGTFWSRRGREGGQSCQHIPGHQEVGTSPQHAPRLH